MGYAELVKEKGLKAGVHLFQGDNYLKTITGAKLHGSEWIQGETTVSESVINLFGSSAWLYSAIQKRKSYMRQIAVSFFDNGEKVDTTSFSGINLDSLARIDMTIQLYGVAYFFKDLELGGTVDLQYLNPQFMTGKVSTRYHNGYREYHYGDPNGKFRTVDEEDLLIIKELGTSEYDPQISATHASATQSSIMLGMATTMLNFYNTNGLPVVAIIVPEETEPEAIDAIQSRFDSVFGRFRNSSNKVIGLSGDVKIEIISFSPKDLAMGDLSDQQIDAILASQEVPPALVYRTVNRAEAELKMQELLMTLDSRAKMITDTINNDPLFSKTHPNITMKTDINKHSIFQKSNLEIATSIQLLTGTPILTINEGRAMLELEAILGGNVLFRPQVSNNIFNNIEPTQQEVESELVEVEEGELGKVEVEEEDTKSLEWKQEASVFNRWLKRRENPDIDSFKAEFLTDTDKKKLTKD